MDWKKQYTAQLMNARADLFWQLIDLTEKELTETAVFANWSPKDLLNHIAEWDLFFAHRLQKAINHEPLNIKSFSTHEWNEQLYQKHRSASLIDSIKLFTQSREQFLHLLPQLNDPLRHATFPLPDGKETAVQRWLDLRYLHDQMHSTDLKKWRERESIPSQIGHPKLIEQAAIASRNQFTALIELIPTEERTTRPICGVWTVKDLLGHIADWELFGVAGLRDILAGNAVQTPFSGTIQSWNDAHAAERQADSWEKVELAWQESRSELIQQATQLRSDDWERPFTPPWGGKQINGYQWLRIWLDHEQEHAHQLAELLI